MHAPVFDQLMLVASWLGHPVMFPFYMTMVLVWSWRRPEHMPIRNVVVFSVGYLVTSVIVVPVIKSLLDFPRPVTVFGEKIITIIGNQDAIYSFPSGHAAYATLMVASLMPGCSRAGKYAMLGYVFMVCFSRISVGAHFPVDVIAGAGISLLIVNLIRALLPA